MRLFIKRNAMAIALFLVLIWAVVIFAFSAADATDSSKTSNGVTAFLCSLFIPGFNDMSEIAKFVIIRHFSLIVRKTAHFTEYMILGFLLYTAVHVLQKRRSVRYGPVLAWLTGTLYAVSDEVHQHFVPGRAMKLFDMLIDSSGTLLGVAFGCLFFALYQSPEIACHKEKRIRPQKSGHKKTADFD